MNYVKNKGNYKYRKIKAPKTVMVWSFILVLFRHIW